MQRMHKILLVEDNEMNRDMLSRRLDDRGYQVILATDGVQGLSLARSEQPDLVVMDLSLPEMDGWEVIRRLKTEPNTQHIPIMVLTAHAMASDRAKAFTAGCDDFDTKPIVDFRRLLAKIESLVLPEKTA